ncbi:MAG: phenylalanine--tRNA ligase subunit alpha [Patescibacteria group bacterium]|nr:phenylalanine--tRNA ligase subunit alpha [Patescibacteria group bacterium]
MKAKFIIKNFISKLKGIKDLDSLVSLKKEYLGKQGEIAQILVSLKNLPEDKRKKLGQEANLLKSEIQKMLEEKSEEIKTRLRKLKLEKEKIDITRPGKKIEWGHLHPLTLVQKEIQQIFQSMGFSIVEGPELETEWYNFDALNMPKDHPARDMQDTLWLKQKRTAKSKENFLMRTHTSPVQVRYMERHNPPFRIIVLGKVFRNERTDASHECQFYQCEGLMVDKDISVANFKAIIEEFLKRFFNKNIKTRLRPGYFPFTEPSFELDINCQNCQGKGCSVCKQSGWLEIIPGGMVHPNVFKAAGLIPRKKSGREWQGFAFGMGVDRLAMMKYKINDIRLFYSGDLRFLKQF